MSNSNITQILTDRFDIQAKPGSKTNCPFCGHHTMGIKRDDSLAKCFHPSCGRFISIHGEGDAGRYQLSKVLQTVFADWHSELIKQSVKGGNAWIYLTEERHIHPQVALDSMLGIVPSSYNVDERFTEVISSLSQVIADSDDAAIKQLAVIREAREKLSRCIKGAAGWLCLFYSDEHHNIAGIKLRAPYSKQMRHFKPFDFTGLFGHGLFSADQSKAHFDRLIVVEGEFNQLQLQSLAVRYGEDNCQDLGYVEACAVGSVTGADIGCLSRLAKRPLICYDNDASNAGFKLVEKAQSVMSVSAFTTAKTNSDLDSHIRWFGNDHTTAWESIKRLIGNTTTYARQYEGIANQVFEIRQKQKGRDSRREFEINAEVAQLIGADLDDRGQFFQDSNNAYFFRDDDKALMPIHYEDDQCRLQLGRYGLNPVEKVYRYVVESLWQKAYTDGIKTEIQRLSYYCKVTNRLFVSNHANQIYRVSTGDIQLVDNGTDGVLFLSDSRATPYQMVELTDSISYLDRIILKRTNFVSDFLNPADRSVLFTIWILSILFRTKMSEAPILAMLGEKGSGKSVTLRKIGLVLIGESFHVIALQTKADDFDAAITNSRYVALDNADTKCSWLPDRLAVVATGGQIQKRELYTTNKLRSVDVKCHLALTTRTPHFGRDDIADRIILMKVDRFEQFIPSSVLATEVLEHRDEIMTELIGMAQDVLSAFEQHKNNDDRTAFRMADFGDLAMKIARLSDTEERMRSVLAKLGSEQSAFAVENDPISEYLIDWVEENPDREISSPDLLKELSEKARDQNTKFPFEGNSQGFGQRLRHLRSNLEEFMTITVRDGRSRRKLYRFKLKDTNGDRP